MPSGFWLQIELALSVLSLLGALVMCVGAVWAALFIPWQAWALLAGGGCFVALHQGLEGWLVKQARRD